MERCSFCGKSKDQVAHLIQGGGKPPAADLPTVYICNECVDLCAHIVHPPPPTIVKKKEPLPERIADWARIEVDGVQYRWSAVRTSVYEKLGEPGTPMVVILVAKLGEQALGVLHPDGTVATPELAAEAIRTKFAPP